MSTEIAGPIAAAAPAASWPRIGQRLAVRAAVICGVDLAVQLPPIYLIAYPLSPHDAWQIAFELSGNATLFGFGLALALELGEHRRPVSRLLRVLLMVAAAAAAVFVTAAWGRSEMALSLGLTTSEHALTLHNLWSVSGIAVLATLYFGSRRDTLRAEDRCRQHELQGLLARRRVVASEARAAQSRVDPQTLFDCLGRAQALYPADPARADAVLDHLTDYLRLTLAGSRLAETTIAHELAVAEALLRVGGAPAALEVRIVEPAGACAVLPGLISELLREWASAEAGTAASAAYSVVCERSTGGLRIELSGATRPPDAAVARCRARLADADATEATVASRRDGHGRFIVSMEIAQ